MNKLYIAGFGVGDERLWTEIAKKTIYGADRLLAVGGLCCTLSEKPVCGSLMSLTLSELAEELNSVADGVTVVLVRGDCGFFSVSKSIVERFSALYDIELINGISSVQYLSAKTAVPYDDALICSMHGRDSRIVPKVAYNKKVFALTGGAFKAHDICGLLSASGLAGVRVCVGERLSYPGERIVTGTAAELAEVVFDDLSVMLIENAACRNPHLPLNDDDFTRGEIPMTKSEVRWLSIQKLGVAPTDIVYDIGSGTGSVSVELARRAFDGLVYAIDARQEASSLTETNRIKHGAYNVHVVTRKAPYGLDELPAPNKAFIGGSGGGFSEILGWLVTKNPSVRVTANAITLQSVHRILEGFLRHGFTETDVICVNIARSRKINGLDLMTAQNPVYIITGGR